MSEFRAGSEPGRSRAVDVVGVRIPDSAVATAAHNLAMQHSDPILYGHVVRTFLYASLLGQHDGARWDEEALYVGCILHDIGLTDDYDDPSVSFEHVSAGVARDLTLQFGWDRPRCDDVARSIVLHMAREISLAESTETRLLSAGVSLDVSGRRFEEIDSRQLDAILARFPRKQFKPAFAQLMQNEADRKPGSSASTLMEHGLYQRIINAPFEDTP